MWRRSRDEQLTDSWYASHISSDEEVGLDTVGLWKVLSIAKMWLSGSCRYARTKAFPMPDAAPAIRMFGMAG